MWTLGCALVGLATRAADVLFARTSPAAARLPLSWRRSCTGSPGWLSGLSAGASGMARSYFLHPATRALVSNSFVRALVGSGVTPASALQEH